MSVIRITWQNIFDANDRGELVQRMPVIIGRSKEAHLQPGDQFGGVSRSHARIDYTEDGWDNHWKCNMRFVSGREEHISFHRDWFSNTCSVAVDGKECDSCDLQICSDGFDD